MLSYDFILSFQSNTGQTYGRTYRVTDRRTYGRTYGVTDGRMDTTSYRDVWSHLKRSGTDWSLRRGRRNSVSHSPHPLLRLPLLRLLPLSYLPMNPKRCCCWAEAGYKSAPAAAHWDRFFAFFSLSKDVTLSLARSGGENGSGGKGGGGGGGGEGELEEGEKQED